MFFADIFVVFVILAVIYLLEVNRLHRRKMPQVPKLNLLVSWNEFPGSPEYTETIYENQIPRTALSDFTKDPRKLGDLAEYLFFQIVNGEAFVEKASVDGQIFTGKRLRGRWSKYGLMFDAAFPAEIKSHLHTDDGYKYKYNGKNLAGLYALDPKAALLVACRIKKVGTGSRNRPRGLQFTYRIIRVVDLLNERKRLNARYPDFSELVAGIRTKLDVPLNEDVLSHQEYQAKNYSRRDLSQELNKRQRK